MFRLQTRRAITQAAMLCVVVCLMTACSTVNRQSANPPAAQTDTPPCRVPGHFCQTFFGP